MASKRETGQRQDEHRDAIRFFSKAGPGAKMLADVRRAAAAAAAYLEDQVADVAAGHGNGGTDSVRGRNGSK